MDYYSKYLKYKKKYINLKLSSGVNQINLIGGNVSQR